MKKYSLILSFAFLLSGLLSSSAQVATWNFDESSGNLTTESVSNTQFTYQQGRNYLERATGVSGSAFRSDGYSTWVSGNLNTNLPNQNMSVSAWLALESYPVQTASILSIWNPTSKQGFELSVNKFGQIHAKLNLGGGAEVFTSSESLPHYAWSYVVLTVEGSTGTVQAYLNGQLVLDAMMGMGTFTFPEQVLIGKSNREVKREPFDQNVLNGILDEINIWDQVFNTSEISNQYSDQLPDTAPDLSVPEERFAGDYFRSQYHPIPQAAWTNESHGLIYYNNQYHMFSQKNSNGSYFSNQTWAHFVSDDLYDWQEVQPALWPQNQFDSVGTWSGHLILDENDEPIIYYTGVDGRIASIHLAKSEDDDLLVWNKPDSINPLVAESPFLDQGKDFRDPFVFRENDSWYMIIGSGTPEGAGTLPLYKSDDLENWDLIGSLYTGNPIIDFAGSFWEMPVFWKFGEKYVLLVTKIPEGGNLAEAFYWVGDFVNEEFVPDNPVPKDFEIINGALSPAFATDEEGRVICIGIIPDEVSGEVHYDLGWANLFTLPRVLTLDESTGTLIQQIHPNIANLEQPQITFNDLSISPTGSNYLNNLRGFQYEIKATFQRGDASQVGFILGANSNGSEQTRVYYDYISSQFVFERINSTTEAGFPRDNRTGFYALEAGEDLEMRVFIDGSVLEVYVNEEAAFSARYFPSSADHNRIDLFTEGGTATASSVEIFFMSEEPLTTGLGESFPQEEALGIYPNPTSERFLIDAALKPGTSYQLSIWDAKGKLVKDLSLKAHDLTKPISMTGLPEGVYICYLRSGEEGFKVRRLVVK